MSMALLVMGLAGALWSAPAANPGGGKGSGEGELEQRYEDAKKRARSAGERVAQLEAAIAAAGGSAERLRYARELEGAMKELEKSRAGLDELRAQIKPGTALWDKEQSHAPDPRAKVPEVGDSGPVDPWAMLGLQPHGLPRQGPAPPAVSYQRPPGRQPPEAHPAPETGGGVPRILRALPRPEPEPDPARPPEGPRPAPPPAGPEPEPARPVDFVADPPDWEFASFPALTTPVPSGGESPLSPAAILRALRERYERGDHAGALREADRLLEARPGDGRVHYLRAVALNRLGRWAEAAAAARQALDAGAARAAVYEELAWAQLHDGLYAEAAASAARALELSPSSALAYAIRAAAFERLGRHQDKQDAIRSAAALSPARFGAAARRTQSGGRLFDPAGRDGFTPAEPGSPRPGRAARAAAALLLVSALGAAALLRRRRR